MTEEAKEVRICIDWLMEDPDMSATDASIISQMVRKPEDRKTLIRWIEENPLATSEEIADEAFRIRGEHH